MTNMIRKSQRFKNSMKDFYCTISTGVISDSNLFDVTLLDSGFEQTKDTSKGITIIHWQDDSLTKQKWLFNIFSQFGIKQFKISNKI